jgi:putative transposase
MPAKNALKQYTENTYYHLYNRGVDKQNIFRDEQDYGVFLSYLKTYLLPKEDKKLSLKLANSQIDSAEKNKLLKLLHLNNFSDEIVLIAYCLMPNHFHLLVKQKSNNSIDKFMRSFGTRYTHYFNKKYNRVGPLYQSVYKAVIVESEEQLLYLTSYIHRNPLEHRHIIFSQPSSLPEYLGQRNCEWIHIQEVLRYFSKTNSQLSYQSFVTQSEDISFIHKILIDKEM